MHQEELLKKIRAQDRSAIQYLYDRAYQPIESYVRNHLGHITDAEDIFHDAFLILYDKIKSPDFELTTNLTAYLLGICKFLVLRRQSKAHKMPLTNTTDIILTDQVNLEEDFFEHEQYQLFSKYFEQLGKDCKKVLLLFFKKVSMANIADKMGYSSEAYAKKRKFKCQKKLIEMIKADPLYNELQDK